MLNQFDKPDLLLHYTMIDEGIPLISDGRELGVAYLGDAPKGYFTYFAGAEVAHGTQDERFVTWELPGREYIICTFEAEDFQ